MSLKLPRAIALLWDMLLRRRFLWTYLIFGTALWLLAGSVTLAQTGALTPLPNVQGTGRASPRVDATVTTWGRVTGLTADGFFLQDPTGDGDAATSDGVFVYTYRAPAAEFGVTAGACVRVQGQVEEYYGKTEISRVGVVTASDLCGNGGIVPVELPQLHPGDDQATVLEPLEGMLVRLAWTAGIVHGPAHDYASGERELALLDPAWQRGIGPVHVFHDQPAALIFLSDRLGQELPPVDWGAALHLPAEGLVGVLDYAFGKYQLLPLPGQNLEVGTAIPRPEIELPPLAVDEYGVCTYNAHGLGRGRAQFPDDEEYAQALRRAAAVLAGPLASCTIVALQETGRLEDGVALAEMLAADHGRGYMALALPGPATHDPEFPLTNSFLVDRERVVVRDLRQVQTCTDVDYGIAAPGVCAAGSYAVFDRPPLAAHLTITGSWPAAQELWVISNHWKSKSGDETANAKLRLAQAHAVAAVVTELAADGTPVIVAGDLNDFYGGPAVAALLDQTGLIQPYDWLAPADRYTYLFNGAAQVLDHLLVSPQLTGQTALVQIVHIHADVAGAPSDHDPVVLRLRPTGAAALGGTLRYPGIKVTAEDGAGAPLASTVTDSQGFFRLWGLPPGTVNVRFAAPPWITLSTASATVTVAPGYHPLVDIPQATHAAVTFSVWLAGAAPLKVETAGPPAAPEGQSLEPKAVR